MFKTIALLMLGAVLGGSLSLAAVKLNYVELPKSWQKIDLERARASMSPKDDPDCFPEPSIVTNAQREDVRANAAAVIAHISEEHRAIFRNLVRGDGPIPYKGQAALRSAAILHSLLQLNACLTSGEDEDTTCPKLEAGHLFTERAAVFGDLRRDAAYKAGLWTLLLKRDLEESNFCDLR